MKPKSARTKEDNTLEIKKLFTQVAATEKRAEAARKEARLAKAKFKAARKAFKQAKKEAKRARKEAEKALETLQKKRTRARTARPAKRGSSTDAPRIKSPIGPDTTAERNHSPGSAPRVEPAVSGPVVSAVVPEPEE